MDNIVSFIRVEYNEGVFELSMTASIHCGKDGFHQLRVARTFSGDNPDVTRSYAETPYEGPMNELLVGATAAATVEAEYEEISKLIRSGKDHNADLHVLIKSLAEKYTLHYFYIDNKRIK